uniref:C2H2-type domain-containing protein n=1 Tax=Timema monikensis TaxID=170555 RepID=A0A7R9ECU9_9NEOP|nr:unnamed protein product [Timema monikensis]
MYLTIIISAAICCVLTILTSSPQVQHLARRTAASHETDYLLASNPGNSEGLQPHHCLSYDCQGNFRLSFVLCATTKRNIFTIITPTEPSRLKFLIASAYLLLECLSSTMKCEDIEEDNDKSEILHLSTALSTLDPSSLPTIKEEIKGTTEGGGSMSYLPFALNQIASQLLIHCSAITNHWSQTVLALEDRVAVLQISVESWPCQLSNRVQRNRLRNRQRSSPMVIQPLNCVWQLTLCNMWDWERNEPDCHGTQLKLECPFEFELNYIIKPETNSNEPAGDVCEEPGFKEELCFEESSIDISENNKIGLRQNLTNEIDKNIFMGGQIMDTTFLKNEIILYQNNNEKYKCRDYGKSYTKNINLKSQLLTQCERRPYKCDVCGKCFKYKYIIKTHLITHSEHRSHKCDCFKRNSNLKAHLIRHSEQRPHMCDVCGKCFKRNMELKSHLIRHSEHRPHMCDVCGKCFKEKETLKTHLITHSEHRPHKCDVCGKCFKYKGSIKTHLTTHSEHRSHKCDCFKGNSDLKSHLFSHSELYPHKCDICGNIFKCKGNLKRHVIIHGEHRPHKCDICGKCFTFKSNLKTHVTIHGEHRPHKCDVCGKCFKQNQYLKFHLVTHSEDRPHKCDVCGKCFKLNKYLKFHLFGHSEDRPHKCDICGQCFKEKVSLKIHFVSHTEHTSTNVMFVANIVNTDLTNVIFVANVLNLRLILKHMSLFMVITEHTNVMFVLKPALQEQQCFLYLAVPSFSAPSYVRIRTTVKHYVAGNVKRTVPNTVGWLLKY